MSENNIKNIYEYPELKTQECIISQWTAETDFDDYIDCTFGHLHYKLINELLLLINSHNFFELSTIITQNNSKSKFLINQFTQMCGKYSKEISECISIHYANILILYDAINKQPTFIDYYGTRPQEIRGKDLHLYRGFHSKSDIFFNIIEKSIIISDELDENENGKNKYIITTPTFLSTSIIPNVAKRFLNKDAYTSIDKKIMWKIIVPYNKLSEFRYIYFGDTINIDKYKIGQNGEFEFLLNIGALLFFIKEEKIINEYYQDISFPNGINISYTLYTYEFKGWNYEYYRHINATSEYFINLFQSTKPVLRSSRRMMNTDMET
jgi:hypothetical protein